MLSRSCAEPKEGILLSFFLLLISFFIYIVRDFSRQVKSALNEQRSGDVFERFRKRNEKKVQDEKKLDSQYHSVVVPVNINFTITV